MKMKLESTVDQQVLRTLTCQLEHHLNALWLSGTVTTVRNSLMTHRFTVGEKGTHRKYDEPGVIGAPNV